MSYHALVLSQKIEPWLALHVRSFGRYLRYLGVSISTLVAMNCDNKIVTFIANNPVFHEQTKQIEVDCNFIRDVVFAKKNSTYISTNDRLAPHIHKASS